MATTTEYGKTLTIINPSVIRNTKEKHLRIITACYINKSKNNLQNCERKIKVLLLLVFITLHETDPRYCRLGGAV